MVKGWGGDSWIENIHVLYKKNGLKRAYEGVRRKAYARVGIKSLSCSQQMRSPISRVLGDKFAGPIGETRAKH